MSITIYHNPRCSKSRNSLALLTCAGVEPVVVEYLKTPPDAERIRLDWFGQPPQVTAATGSFYRILTFSTIPALASIALKNHADALNRAWTPFWIFFSGVLLNILLNWIMIFGKLGCPALGFEGAAWATLIARTAILVAMIVWLNRSTEISTWVPRRWFRRPQLESISQLLRLGIPASLQMLTEVTAFCVAGLNHEL